MMALCLQAMCLRLVVAALQLHTLAYVYVYAAPETGTGVGVGAVLSNPPLLKAGDSFTLTSPNHESSSPSEHNAPDIAPTKFELESAAPFHTITVPETLMSGALPTLMDPWLSAQSHGRTVTGLSTFGPQVNDNSSANPWPADPSHGPTVIGLPTQDTQPNYDSPDTAETILALLAQAKTREDTHRAEVQFAEVSTVKGVRWQTLGGCASKGFGWVDDPHGPRCRYFCLGAQSLGMRMCCTGAACFDLPTPVYPSGSCIVCPTVSPPSPRYAGQTLSFCSFS